jgi:hypothetical protein
MYQNPLKDLNIERDDTLSRTELAYQFSEPRESERIKQACRTYQTSISQFIQPVFIDFSCTKNV